MCRFWVDPSDLGSQVSRSLIKLIKSKPQTGWIKADVVTSEEANQEIATLRKHVNDLEAQLQKARTTAPEGAEGLSDGDDKFILRFNYYYSGDNDDDIELSWNKYFYILAPLMLDEATEFDLDNELQKYLREIIQQRPRIININSEDFQTIKVQFVALGLIGKSEKKRSIKDSSTYWTLTPYGETKIMQLRALRK